MLNGGDTTKDFVPVEDVARAFVKAVASDFVGAINIGTGRESKLRDVAAQIAHEMKMPFSCGADKTPTRMQANITRAKRILNWEPSSYVWEDIGAIVHFANKASTVSA